MYAFAAETYVICGEWCPPGFVMLVFGTWRFLTEEQQSVCDVLETTRLLAQAGRVWWTDLSFEY